MHRPIVHAYVVMCDHVLHFIIITNSLLMSFLCEQDKNQINLSKNKTNNNNKKQHSNDTLTLA